MRLAFASSQASRLGPKRSRQLERAYPSGSTRSRRPSAAGGASMAPISAA